VAQGKTATRLHESRVPVRYGQPYSGGDERAAAPRIHRRTHPCDEVGAGVSRAGVFREWQVWVEDDDRDVEHHPNLALSRVFARRRRARGYVLRVLAWMDLEMTGLDPSRHVIVEIATLITDDNLQVVAEGPDLVISASADEMAGMDDVVRAMHTKSGLLTAIEASTATLADAGEATLKFLREHIPEPGQVPLCGNSIGTDRRFLATHLPDVESYLHYRSIDVSTIKELARRWYPTVFAGAPKKTGTHRAMGDILESVGELRYYRQTVFRDDGAKGQP
jgi:oligoribonuclease